MISGSVQVTFKSVKIMHSPPYKNVRVGYSIYPLREMTKINFQFLNETLHILCHLLISRLNGDGFIANETRTVQTTGTTSVSTCRPSYIPNMVDDYASIFNCTAVVRASDSMAAFS